jgi:hypothetical protein
MYHLQQVTEMGGCSLSHTQSRHFMGCCNIWVEVTLLWCPGSIPQLRFLFVSL